MYNNTQKSDEAAMGLSNMRLVDKASLPNMLHNRSVIQLRHKKIIVYDANDHPFKEKSAELMNGLNSCSSTYNGEMSSCARKSISKLLYCWQIACDANNDKSIFSKSLEFRRLVFITVTLSSTQFNSDEFIKAKLLAPFMRTLKLKYNCENYLWRAEKQKNGNIHFHIVIDRFVVKEAISKIWNNIQTKRGYLDTYIKLHGDNNAPSTNIQVIRDLENLDKYMSKYLGKDEKNGTITGRIWRASKGLDGLSYFSFDADNHTFNRLTQLKLAERIEVKQTDNCTIVYTKDVKIESIIPLFILLLYKKYILCLENILFDNYHDIPFDELFNLIKRGHYSQFVENHSPTPAPPPPLYIADADQLNLF